MQNHLYDIQILRAVLHPLPVALDLTLHVLTAAVVRYLFFPLVDRLLYGLLKARLLPRKTAGAAA